MKNFEIKITFSADKAEMKDRKIELVKGNFEATGKGISNIFTNEAIERMTLLSLLKVICSEEEEELMNSLKEGSAEATNSMASILFGKDDNA